MVISMYIYSSCIRPSSAKCSFKPTSAGNSTTMEVTASPFLPSALPPQTRFTAISPQHLLSTGPSVREFYI